VYAFSKLSGGVSFRVDRLLQVVYSQKHQQDVVRCSGEVAGKRFCN
jgi:hypothetical protein